MSAGGQWPCGDRFEQADVAQDAAAASLQAVSNDDDRSSRVATRVADLIDASVVLSLSMGLRQSFGVFMPPLTRGIGISVSQFCLSIAVQVLAWCFMRPLAGAWAVRLGLKRPMLAGSLTYVPGLVMLATAQGLWGMIIGARIVIGITAGLHRPAHRHGSVGAQWPAPFAARCRAPSRQQTRWAP